MFAIKILLEWVTGLVIGRARAKALAFRKKLLRRLALV
jgi:hypothetical protein